MQSVKKFYYSDDRKHDTKWQWPSAKRTNETAPSSNGSLWWSRDLNYIFHLRGFQLLGCLQQFYILEHSTWPFSPNLWTWWPTASK